MHWQDLPAPILGLLRQGSVIPAHPLALGPDRRFDRPVGWINRSYALHELRRTAEAHEALLAQLDKESKGKTVWRKLQTA